jgi:hypothetical protein
MVTEVLVEKQIEDGRRFLTNLVRAGFDVTIAFWTGRSDRGLRHLYIASPQIVPGQLANISDQLYVQLQHVPNSAVEFGQLRLLPHTDPTARDALSHRDRPKPVQVFGNLGNLDVEWAYIYEPITAELTRDEVIEKVISLMEGAGPIPPSKVSLRDGSVLIGVPIGLQRQGNEIVVSIFDPTTQTYTPVPAHLVSNIE